MWYKKSPPTLCLQSVGDAVSLQLNRKRAENPFDKTALCLVIVMELSDQGVSFECYDVEWALLAPALALALPCLVCMC